MNAATEAIANADAHLSNAGLMTYSEMAELLSAATKLGLNFDIGRATILRQYIHEQTALCARIVPALDAFRAARG